MHVSSVTVDLHALMPLLPIPAQFGKDLARLAATLPSPMGRRPSPLPNDTNLLIVGNSHTRQVLKELLCQYGEEVVEYCEGPRFRCQHPGLPHTSLSPPSKGWGYTFSVAFRNNATLTGTTNSLYVYSDQWALYIEAILGHRLDWYDAILVGKFNGVSDSRGTNFFDTAREFGKEIGDIDFLREDAKEISTVDFEHVSPPTLADFAAVYKGPLVYMGMFAKYSSRVTDRSTMTMEKEWRENKRGNIQVIDGRKYVNAIGECGSDARVTEGPCFQFGDDTHGQRSAENMHRCVGKLGGHPTLMVWEVIESLHNQRRTVE